MHHLVEHVIAFNLIFGDGVLVAIGAQADAVAQLIHRVDVIHPAAIHAGEQHDALQLAGIDVQQLEALFAQGVEIARFLLELGDQLVFIDGLERLFMRLEEANADAQAFQILRQAGQIPIGVVVAVAAVGRDGLFDKLVRHLDDGFVHIAAFEHLLALLIDLLALLVHHVVILKHVLTDFVVARLNALLSILNLSGEHLRFDRLVLSQTHLLNQAADAFTAEQAHQIILHGEEELGGTRIALTARAAAQLIVDTAGLVALRADDVQAADGDHAVVFRVRLLLEPRVELFVNHARGKHFFADVLVEAGRFLDHVVLIALLLHRAAGEELRVAAQQDIRAAARHVRGDGDRAEVTGLRDDFRLAGVILRVQHDMLDAVVALPDQMFYNTGIYTYVWIVTNKKPAHRQGKVLLIDGTRHFKKMDKSLGNKRNELSDEHIKELVHLYAEHKHDAQSEVIVDGKLEQRVCSKLFDNREFGFLKITVERPLRLNFLASAERIAKLDGQSAFANLASSKKRKNETAYAEEVAEGKATQAAIKAALQNIGAETLYRNRPAFAAVLDAILKDAGIKIGAPVKKAILTALSERDSLADICRDNKGFNEPDPDLRDTEIVALPSNITLPLPLDYDNETGHDKLLALVKNHCEAYLKAEVLPHVSDAWIDHSKTKIGYEIPLARHFYVYQQPRPLAEIADEISQLEKDIVAMLSEVV